MCGLAPIALPSLAKGAVAPKAANDMSLMALQPGESIFTKGQRAGLKINVDTSEVNAWLEKHRTIRFLDRIGKPMKPAADAEVPAMYAGVPIDPGPAGFEPWDDGDPLMWSVKLNDKGYVSGLTWSGHAAGPRGDWMQLASGRQFFPLDPRPEEIFIDDIAASLSKLCRFGGHTRRFYSVAEHCVHVANAAWPQIALDALLHDASEAYLSDVIRPIKPFLSNYREIEERLEAAIAERFRLDWPMPAEIKRLDNAILADERDQAMATPPADWRLPEPPHGVTLQFWSPEKAEYEFLAAFRRLAG
jgi:hypothetical protein